MIKKIPNSKSQIPNKFQISNFKFQIGFTLIELVISMAIIAILAAGIWGNFFPSIIKGRDSRRKQDLQQIGKALELYYTDNKGYPSGITPGVRLTHPANSNVIYMQKLPDDPSTPTYTYCYLTDGGGSYYKLYAYLENSNDKALITPVSCNSKSYNYGVSSPNVTP